MNKVELYINNFWLNCNQCEKYSGDVNRCFWILSQFRSQIKSFCDHGLFRFISSELDVIKFLSVEDKYWQLNLVNLSECCVFYYDKPE